LKKKWEELYNNWSRTILEEKIIKEKGKSDKKKVCVSRWCQSCKKMMDKSKKEKMNEVFVNWKRSKESRLNWKKSYR
jgi:hypothetical protein